MAKVGPVPMTEDELLAALRRYAELTGCTPSASRVERDGPHLEWLPSHTTYQRRFGSWAKALERAGLPDAEAVA